MTFKPTILIIPFLFLSCNFGYETKVSKRTNEVSKNNDSVLKYYNNGTLKSKGVSKGSKKKGWWTYYDSVGRKSKKIEYIPINDGSYKNQEIIFAENSTIKYQESNFFNVLIKDTLRLGKNIGTVEYYSNKKDFELQNVYVIIDNEYEQGIIKKDSFIDSPNKSRFGFFGLSTGKKVIKGTILEQLAYKKQIVKGKDSFELKIINIKRYFWKKVFIKD